MTRIAIALFVFVVLNGCDSESIMACKRMCGENAVRTYSGGSSCVPGQTSKVECVCDIK